MKFWFPWSLVWVNPAQIENREILNSPLLSRVNSVALFVRFFSLGSSCFSGEIPSPFLLAHTLLFDFIQPRFHEPWRLQRFECSVQKTRQPIQIRQYPSHFDQGCINSSRQIRHSYSSTQEKHSEKKAGKDTTAERLLHFENPTISEGMIQLKFMDFEFEELSDHLTMWEFLLRQSLPIR